MALEPKPRTQNRKRQHAEADLSQDDLPPPPKRFKSPREDPSSSRFSPPEFWDCLSKVWLTRRALRELDRRNQSGSSACAPALAPKPVHQFLGPKRLQRFARHGGPELRDLRGYPEPTDINLAHTMSSKRSGRSGRSGNSSHSSRSSGSKESKSTKPSSNSASETSKKRSSSAYDANFEARIIEKNIYLEGYEHPDGRQTPEPTDFDQVRQTLAASRASLSPSQFTESNFRKFKRANTRVIIEDDVMREVIPTMCGETDIPNRQNLFYTKLESITDNTTVVPKPDFYDGARLENIDKRVLEVIDEELINRQAEEDPSKEPYSYIVPTKHAQAPVAPNFFLEAKAPRGGADVAKRQACLDGALGARAMHKLQSYVAGEPVFDNKILSMTSTYHDGTLKMYATHVTPTGLEGGLEYHMTQTGAHAVIGGRDQCVQGFTELRNGRNWTQEKRNGLIAAANERARSMNVELSTLESSNHDDDASDSYRIEDSQTSVDDFAITSFSYPVEDSQTSVDLAVTSFSHPVNELYYDLSDVAEEEYEEDEIYADEPDILTYTDPTASKKRPGKGSEKPASKAPRHDSGTSRRKHHSE